MRQTDLRRVQLPRTAKGLLPAAAGVAVVVVGLPLVSGVGWPTVGRALGRVSVPEVSVLTAIWLAGLWLHTIAIAAALPGLSRPRAFFLNLTGSAVSNLVPLGGTAGTALNYWSCRRWGFSVGAFIRWALVTNYWDNALKVVLPGVAVSWLVLDGIDPGPRLMEAAVSGLLVGAAYVALGWLMLHRAWGSRALASAARRVARRLGYTPDVAEEYATEAAAFPADTRQLVRAAYGQLTVGTLAYAALQALLLWACLATVGESPAPALVFAAFSVERLASIAVLTPGASGLAEMGTVGVLVALDVAPATAVAGVLLYRAFVFWLEIPTGGALLGVLEALLRRRGQPRPMGAAHVPALRQRAR